MVLREAGQRLLTYGCLHRCCIAGRKACVQLFRIHSEGAALPLRKLLQRLLDSRLFVVLVCISGFAFLRARVGETRTRLEAFSCL